MGSRINMDTNTSEQAFHSAPDLQIPDSHSPHEPLSPSSYPSGTKSVPPSDQIAALWATRLKDQFLKQALAQRLAEKKQTYAEWKKKYFEVRHEIFKEYPAIALLNQEEEPCKERLDIAPFIRAKERSAEEKKEGGACRNGAGK